MLSKNTAKLTLLSPISEISLFCSESEHIRDSCSKDVETRGKLPLVLGENFLSPRAGLPVLLPFVAVYVGKRGKNGGRPVGFTNSVPPLNLSSHHLMCIISERTIQIISVGSWVDLRESYLTS